MQSYSAYEGAREPKYDLLCKLADYFDVTTDYLLGRKDDKGSPVVELENKRAELLKEIGQMKDALRKASDALSWLNAGKKEGYPRSK